MWGDFAAHVARLEALLAATDPGQPVLASVCAAYVEVNDYAAAELPLLRERMQLILTEPALLAHSQVRYADVDRVVARHVAAADRRLPRGPGAAAGRRERRARPRRRRSRLWLADERTPLARQLHVAFDELTEGFPALALTARFSNGGFPEPCS